MEILRPIVGVAGLARLEISGNELRLGGLFGGPSLRYLAVGERLARVEGETIPSFALLEVDERGTYVQVADVTLEQIAGWQVRLRLAAAAAALGLPASSLALALFWLPLRWFRGDRAAIDVRGAPLLASVLLFGYVAVTLAGWLDPVQRLGRVSPFSVGQWLLGLLFLAATAWATFRTVAARWTAGRVVWWHSLLVVAACVLIASVLLAHSLDRQAELALLIA